MPILHGRRSPAPARGRGIVRGAAVPFLVGALIVGAAASLSAHDFWIVPNAFTIGERELIELRGQTSVKFPTSLSAVTVERVADARIIDASGEERIADLSVGGKSLMLRHRPSTPGQRVIAVALVTRSSRAAPAGLKRYIALEGAPALAERYEREGAFAVTDSVTQRTTKYAKTLVAVGRGGAPAFARTAGHALEFVPVTDPSALRVGDTLAVRLLFRGQPLAGAHLHAGAAPEAAVTDSAALPKDWKDVSLTTGADGVARVAINRPGLWNVRTLHAAPAAGTTPGGAASEWEVAFATIVLHAADAPAGTRESHGEVARSGRGQASSDSASARAAVERFHAALASGDSASALALLAPDVIILESGGVETRDEYRSHHLPGDMAFARAVKGERNVTRIVVRGDVAWVSGTSVTQGEYRGRQINSTGAELVVLTRTPEGWRIAAIHWSSRARRAAGG